MQTQTGEHLKLFKLDCLHFYKEKLLFSANAANKTFIFIFSKITIFMQDLQEG